MAAFPRFRFLAIAVIFHFAYIFSIFDIYFVSPIETGMRLFNVERPPNRSAPADRLVLFVGKWTTLESVCRGQPLTTWSSFRRRLARRQGTPVPSRTVSQIRCRSDSETSRPLLAIKDPGTRNFWCFPYARPDRISTRPCCAHRRSVRGCISRHDGVEAESGQF